MRHLWYWQGLRWAPGGLLLLATAAAAAVPLPAPVRWLGWLAALLVAARLHRLAGLYYTRRFPRLRPGAATAGGLVAGAVLAAALAVDARWAPPVLDTAVAGAAVLVAYGLATGGGRPHHMAGVVVLLLLVPLPALGLAGGGRTRVLLWLVCGGCLYAILAVLDHRELALKRRAARRRRPPPRRASRRRPPSRALSRSGR